MLNWFRRRSTGRATAGELYGRVVAQARTAAIYSRHGVADTPVGRYEVLVLHLVLTLERLKAAGAEQASLARDLVEVFVEDMDDSMREMGVGDLTVPRKVKKAAAGLYDRTPLYRAALDAAGNEALAAALEASLPGNNTATVDGAGLARYVRDTAEMLSGQSVDRLWAAA